MSKVVSAGIIVKYHGRYVLGHVTGQDHFDIFKGKVEVTETPIEGALRECLEESSLKFVESDLTYLGFHSYTSKKNLELYITTVDELSMSDLRCTSYCLGELSTRLELDFYATFTFDEMLQATAKSMSRVLSSLRTEIETF